MGKTRPANSTRIRESILATILVTFDYKNQFPPLNCIQTDSVSIEFDSRKLKRICNPENLNLKIDINSCISTDEFKEIVNAAFLCNSRKCCDSSHP